MSNIIFSQIPTDSLIEQIADKVMEKLLRANEKKNNASKPEPGYITRKDVCQLLHITMPTVHSWIKSGKLKAYHVGGRTLFKKSEVLEQVKPANYNK